jgi:hypothetical protein
LRLGHAGHGKLLWGKIRNLGHAPYAGKRTYRLEHWTGSKWTKLHSGLVPPLAPGQEVTVRTTLKAVPKVGTIFRLHISPGDRHAANDSRRFTVPRDRVPNARPKNQNGEISGRF